MEEETSSQSRTGLIVGIVVVLVVFCGLYYFLSVAPMSMSREVKAVIGLVPVGPLFTLDLAQGTATQVILPMTPEGMTVIDEAKIGDATYYLLLSADDFVSNVYKANANEGTLTQVTSSPTLKFGLSAGSEHNRLMYLAGSVASIDAYIAKPSWDVTTLTPEEGTESTIGQGDWAEIVRGSARALVRKAGSLFLVPFSQGESTEILRASGPVAVSPDGKYIGLYNATTGAADVFLFPTGTGTASYEYSIHLPFAPLSLAFDTDNKILAGGAKEDGTASLLYVEQKDRTITIPNPNSTVPAGIEQLMILYE